MKRCGTWIMSGQRTQSVETTSLMKPKRWSLRVSISQKMNGLTLMTSLSTRSSKCMMVAFHDNWIQNAALQSQSGLRQMSLVETVWFLVIAWTATRS